jgi:hypothetical protein
MRRKEMNTMSNYSFGTKTSCLLIGTALFLVLACHTVHAEATHSGEFNFSGPGSTVFIYQNQTNDAQSVFVTVCVSAGGPVNVIGPFSTFAVGLGGCRGSTIDLETQAAVGVNIPTAVTATGTYQLSTRLHLQRK